MARKCGEPATALFSPWKYISSLFSLIGGMCAGVWVRLGICYNNNNNNHSARDTAKRKQYFHVAVQKRVKGDESSVGVSKEEQTCERVQKAVRRQTHIHVYGGMSSAACVCVYVYRPVASAAFFSFFFLFLPVPFIITMPTIWLALFQRASVCVNFLSSDHFYPFAPKIFTQQEILSPKEM